MKRLKIIKPVFDKGGREIADLRTLERGRLRIEQTLVAEGPSSIESAFDEMLAAVGAVAAALQAQAEGCDAVLIDCFGDPGLQPAREALDIPVFGAGECAMHAAAMLGHRFSIVTVLPGVVPMLRQLARNYGVDDKLASIRVIDIPVLDLRRDEQALQQAMGEQACKAVREDGADAIVLGCTGFIGCAQQVGGALERAGLGGVPVVDPIPVAVSMALAMCENGLSHSKRAWAAPPRKPIGGFGPLQAAWPLKPAPHPSAL